MTSTVFAPPIFTVDGVCPLTSISRVEAEARNEGTVTQSSGATATRVVGVTHIGLLTHYNNLGNVCSSVDLTPFPPVCTFYMVRNEVAPGSSVEVEPIDGSLITFDNVVTSGTVEVTQTTVGLFGYPTGLDGFIIAGFQNPYFFTIETDATFTGDVEVCLPYGDLPAIDAVNLLMLRDGELIPVQFVDTVLNRVCATVPGFSEFALATPTPISAPGLGLFGAAILIAALVAAGGITVMRMGATTSA